MSTIQEYSQILNYVLYFYSPHLKGQNDPVCSRLAAYPAFSGVSVTFSCRIKQIPKLFPDRARSFTPLSNLISLYIFTSD